MDETVLVYPIGSMYATYIYIYIYSLGIFTIEINHLVYDGLSKSLFPKSAK